MANNKEHVVEKYVTPKGEMVGFIALTQPSTKFNPEGIYKVDILLSKKDGEFLAEKIKSIRTEQFKKYGKGTKVVDITRCVPYEIVNKETGEATPDAEGRYILKTNAKAFIKDGKVNHKIQIIDINLKPVTQNISIGEGTVAKLALELSGYSVAGKTGVSVKLVMVQIIKLVEFSNSATPESCGFTTEEGEFEFEETTTVATTEEDDGEEEESDF